jgi:hypothetical protein
MITHPMYLKGTTSAPPSLTATTIISTLSITPTIPSHGPPPPPPQPPPAPNIPPSFEVSDTNFASSTALNGRAGAGHDLGRQANLKESSESKELAELRLQVLVIVIASDAFESKKEIIRLRE